MARTIPAVTIGAVIMIASDLMRVIVAFGFSLVLTEKRSSMLYVFSALLMVASPFFTAGRSTLLPIMPWL
jgi:hypothetical protein